LAVAAVALAPNFLPMSAASVREVVDAASAAGFDGLSISIDQHDWAVADDMTSDSFLEYHHERGLAIPAAEVILGWTNADREAVEEANIHVLDIAARSGARTVITATLASGLPPLSEAAIWLQHLCDLAADRGLLISFEFLPWTAVPTVASAVRLIDAVDRDNLGLVIDAWHWFRQPGGPDLATLRSVPPERIHVLHLDDASSEPPPDLMMESGTARLLPGEGAVDIVDLVNLIDDIGATPMVASEVFSSSLRTLGAFENARRQYVAAQDVLLRSRQESPPASTNNPT
jgi:sugar phosphate isomerase/epimerase